MEQSEGGKEDGDAVLENPTRARTKRAVVSDAARARAIECLIDGMDATKRVWDRDNAKWIEEPDWNTRTKNAELVLAYSDGRPVEMKIELSGGFEGYDAKLAKLCSTPEGLKLALQAGLVGDATPKNAKSSKVLEAKVLQSLNKNENDRKPDSQKCEKSNLF